MGKEIEKIATQRGHSIALKINSETECATHASQFSSFDVAIEFSTPASVYNNILKCFDANIPVVAGTTGWLQDFEKIKQICIKKKQALFYAPNFSIGVNIFFEINRFLSKIMNSYSEYEIKIEEIHHVKKLDSPSGTAVHLANDVLKNIKRKKNWINKSKENEDQISIISKRINNIPGIHTINYTSAVDTIEMKHTAHSRKGFALGAVFAAEWIFKKNGIFGMQDLLSEKLNIK